MSLNDKGEGNTTKTNDSTDWLNSKPQRTQESQTDSKPFVPVEGKEENFTEEEIRGLLHEDNPKIKNSPWKDLFTKPETWKSMTVPEREQYVRDRINNIEEIEFEEVQDTQAKKPSVIQTEEGENLSTAQAKTVLTDDKFAEMFNQKKLFFVTLDKQKFSSREEFVASYRQKVLEVMTTSDFAHMIREPDENSVLEYLCRPSVTKDAAMEFAKNKLMRDALGIALSGDTPLEFYIVLRLFATQKKALGLSDDLMEVSNNYGMSYLDTISVLAKRDISSKRGLAAYLKSTLKYHVDGIFKIYELFTS